MRIWVTAFWPLTIVLYIPFESKTSAVGASTDAGSSGMVVYEICVLIRLCGGLQNKEESYTEPC